MSSERETPVDQAHQSADEPAARGPNLTLYYILLGLALAAAISFAIAIVWPFYIRR